MALLLSVRLPAIREAITMKLPRHLQLRSEFRQQLKLDPAAADLKAKDPRYVCSQYQRTTPSCFFSALLSSQSVFYCFAPWSQARAARARFIRPPIAYGSDWHRF